MSKVNPVRELTLDVIKQLASEQVPGVFYEGMNDEGEYMFSKGAVYYVWDVFSEELYKLSDF